MALIPCETIGIVSAAIFSSCIKLLALNSYHSTDFEVHRNWLAITSSLPISQWYFEKTSKWTLDYPPFFAWFEYFLSNIAMFFDQSMLDITNLNYVSKETLLFQRMSVVVCDLLLCYSLHRYCLIFKAQKSVSTDRRLFVMFTILANVGLFFVDHVHFQYNGFLFGFLILSITEMEQGHYLKGAFWFCVLLNLKHIFLYIVPIYFVYLLRSYCFQGISQHKGLWSIIGVSPSELSWRNTCFLATVVFAVFGVSFGPFIYMNQLGQILSRLFPVKRGLSHAYWAANFWALYNSADKFASIVGARYGWLQSRKASLTGGLVAEQDFAILPNVSLNMTALLTITAMLPALVKIWFRPHNRRLFLPALILCAYASFIFGYHVHEKAILLVTIPLTFLAARSPMYARVYVIISVTGYFALFPLLHEDAETTLKIVYYLFYTLTSIHWLRHVHGLPPRNSSFGFPFVNKIEALYLYTLLPLFVYTTFLHRLFGLGSKLPFLPLLITSLYCSIGVLLSWLHMYASFLHELYESKL